MVDIGTRAAHACIALAFFVSYVTSESERLRLVHVYSGYCLAAALVFRLLWGWIGPGSARWKLLLRRLAMWRILHDKLSHGQWLNRHFWIASCSWTLSVVLLCTYILCALAITSGWITYSEWLGDGWLNDVMHEVHEGLGDIAITSVCIHLGLVLGMRIWLGPQALRSMWLGHTHSRK